MKREAKHTTVWNQYLRSIWDRKKYIYYEMKQTTSDSFSFNNFEDHQLSDLQALENNGLVWKFSDQDQRLKPCDGASLPPLPTYVVIKYPKFFAQIRVDTFIMTKKKSEKKSLSSALAWKIAEKVVHF